MKKKIKKKKKRIGGGTRKQAISCPKSQEEGEK